MNGEKIVNMRLKVPESMKNALDELARAEETSASALARKAIQQFIDRSYYERVNRVLNIEDRFGSAVINELLPELEDIKRRIEEISSAPNSSSGEKQEVVIYPEDVKDEEQEFPKIPGLHYKVDGENVVYEDGSIYNLHLGAWLVTKEEVARWRRKKEKERWGL